MSGSPDHEHDLITLVETDSTFHAQSIAAALADADIDALVVEPSALDVAMSAGRKSTTTLVRVRAADEQAAREALAQAREALEQINWDEMDVDDDTPIRSAARANRVVTWIGFAVAVTLIAFVVLVAVIMPIAG